jgi:hypothetical protein
MIQLLGGFLNTEKKGFCCGRGAYKMPIQVGDTFYVLVKGQSDFVFEADSRFTFELVGDYLVFDTKIYLVTVQNIETIANEGVNFSKANFIGELCGNTISENCGTFISDLCKVKAFGNTCYYASSCYEAVLEWEMKYDFAGFFALSQRLPIRIYNPNPKIDGIKTYQKSNGTILKTGKVRAYYEYTLETEYMPELFHRQLLNVLAEGRNLKIGGIEVEFGGEYQINWTKNNCLARATCKMIEKKGIFNC